MKKTDYLYWIKTSKVEYIGFWKEKLRDTLLINWITYFFISFWNKTAYSLKKRYYYCSLVLIVKLLLLSWFRLNGKFWLTRILYNSNNLCLYLKFYLKVAYYIKIVVIDFDLLTLLKYHNFFFKVLYLRDTHILCIWIHFFLALPRKIS